MYLPDMCARVGSPELVLEGRECVDGTLGHHGGSVHVRGLTLGLAAPVDWHCGPWCTVHHVHYQDVLFTYLNIVSLIMVRCFKSPLPLIVAVIIMLGMVFAKYVFMLQQSNFTSSLTSLQTIKYCTGWPTGTRNILMASINVMGSLIFVYDPDAFLETIEWKTVQQCMCLWCICAKWQVYIKSEELFRVYFEFGPHDIIPILNKNTKEFSCGFNLQNVMHL